MENFHFNDVPAIIWGGLMTILGCWITYLTTKKKYQADVDSTVIDTIAKKDKYNNERYDEILQELIEANKKNDELNDKLRTVTHECFVQKEKIATLIARLNVLKTTQ